MVPFFFQLTYLLAHTKSYLYLAVNNVAEKSEPRSGKLTGRGKYNAKSPSYYLY